MGDLKSKGQEALGKAKEKIGEMTNNPDMQAEGASEAATAKAKQAAEKAKETIKEPFK